MLRARFAPVLILFGSCLSAVRLPFGSALVHVWGAGRWLPCGSGVVGGWFGPALCPLRVRLFTCFAAFGTRLSRSGYTKIRPLVRSKGVSGGCVGGGWCGLVGAGWSDGVASGTEKTPHAYHSNMNFPQLPGSDPDLGGSFTAICNLCIVILTSWHGRLLAGGFPHSARSIP